MLVALSGIILPEENWRQSSSFWLSGISNTFHRWWKIAVGIAALSCHQICFKNLEVTVDLTLGLVSKLHFSHSFILFIMCYLHTAFQKMSFYSAFIETDCYSCKVCEWKESISGNEEIPFLFLIATVRKNGRWSLQEKGNRVSLYLVQWNILVFYCPGKG